MSSGSFLRPRTSGSAATTTAQRTGERLLVSFSIAKNTHKCTDWQVAGVSCHIQGIHLKKLPGNGSTSFSRSERKSQMCSHCHVWCHCVVLYMFQQSRVCVFCVGWVTKATFTTDGDCLWSYSESLTVAAVEHIATWFPLQPQSTEA